MSVQLGADVDPIFESVGKARKGYFCWWIGDLGQALDSWDHRHIARLRYEAIVALGRTGCIEASLLQVGQETDQIAHLFEVVKAPSWRQN